MSNERFHKELVRQVKKTGAQLENILDFYAMVNLPPDVTDKARELKELIDNYLKKAK